MGDGIYGGPRSTRDPGSKLDVFEIKKKLVEASRILFMERITEDFAGHISARIDGNEALISRYTHFEGRGMGEVQMGDILRIDLNRRILEGDGELMNETVIHTSVYRARPDVGSVAHLHPPKCVAVSAAGKEVLPILIRGVSFGGPIQVLDLGANLVKTEAQGARVAQKLGDRSALLLRGHGCVVAGATVEECVENAINLERMAEAQIYASVLGSPASFPPEDLQRREIGGKRAKYALWNFYRNKLLRDPLLSPYSQGKHPSDSPP